MFADFSPRIQATRTSHPGSVTFVGSDGTQRTEPADQLPDWLKFAPTADGQLVPVVRVVRVSNGAGFGLRSYGPDGRLVAVTLPVPAAPPPHVEVARPAPKRHANESASEVSGWF